VEVFGLAVKEDVPSATALVAAVFVMQRLVQVADEVDHELESPSPATRPWRGNS
jgi:hypothetical protein